MVTRLPSCRQELLIDDHHRQAIATDRSARTSALIELAIYAVTHDQPLWLPAIRRIMSREGRSDA
jgi:hypothetical protein